MAEVLVVDGQHVAANTPLVRMDQVAQRQDLESADGRVQRLELQLARVNAELSGEAFRPNEEGPYGRAAREEYEARRAAQQNLVAEARMALQRAELELLMAANQLKRAQGVLPLVQKQDDMQQALQQEGFVSAAAAMDKRKELIEAQDEVGIRLAAHRAAQAGAGQAATTVHRLESDYRQQLSKERTEVVLELAQAKAEKAKANHRLEGATLFAPVAGSVTGLSGLVPGNVVPAGEQLLSIVPDDDTLMMEGWIRNEDIGLVYPKVSVQVKAHSFPFQKYGWVEGVVDWIGADSEAPQEYKATQANPLFFKVRVSLAAQKLKAGGAVFPLKPGMQVQGDIKLGTRTVLEYLVSPVKKIMNEAAREK